MIRKLILVSFITLLGLGIFATASQASPSVTNVALGKTVTLNGQFYNGGWSGGTGPVSPSTLVDGKFFAKNWRWDQNTVWWGRWDTGKVEIDLNGTYTIESLVIQADDNDSYKLYYKDLDTGNWEIAWNVPNYDVYPSSSNWGMQTRPNVYDNSERYKLPKPITTNALMFTHDSGDGWYSVSEIQAFGYPAIPDPPAAPTMQAPTALSTTAIRWNYNDNSDDEQRFDLFNQLGNLRGTGGENSNKIIEEDLIPNTQYTRRVFAFNDGGYSLPSVYVNSYTFAVDPNVSADKQRSTWYVTTPITFTNNVPFGENGVAYYKYVWDTSPTHPWTGTEPDEWRASTLSLNMSQGLNYLHVRSYNGDGVASGTIDLGPFHHDINPPNPNGGNQTQTYNTPTSLSPKTDISPANLSLAARHKKIKAGAANILSGTLSGSAGEAIANREIAIKIRVVKQIKQNISGKVSIIKKHVWSKFTSAQTNSNGQYKTGIKLKKTQVFKAFYGGITSKPAGIRIKKSIK